MEIHSLHLFPEPEELSIRIEATSGTPILKIGDGVNGIVIFLMEGESWGWDSAALYRLSEELVKAGRDLAAKAGAAQLVEDQEAV